MRTYSITLLDGFTAIMKKDAAEMKAWINKYNVTDKDGNKLSLNKIGVNPMVIRANGKFLRVSR